MNIPEKFLVTSKVVNMAPWSDVKEGREEVMMRRKETGVIKKSKQETEAKEKHIYKVSEKSFLS